MSYINQPAISLSTSSIGYLLRLVNRGAVWWAHKSAAVIYQSARATGYTADRGFPSKSIIFLSE